ncbi:sodium- and chloride-dependent neutral and basic amino acid transporter B(0+)-like [Lytechinus pictus]|uniref:sodium- and chloride-dependent neutral and basic amino acid transporter B(0+)-like n=1 Tax=Lytechinus pictus TaxID=7653 RepID=UPI0030B9DAAB
MVNPEDSNGSARPRRTPGANAAAAYLPAGVSLSARATPVQYQPNNGGASRRPSNTSSVASHLPPGVASARATPRATPVQHYQPSNPSNSRRPSNTSSAAAYLPPGVSLGSRTTPNPYQPSSGRTTPRNMFVPISGRSTPMPDSGRTTPISNLPPSGRATPASYAPPSERDTPTSIRPRNGKTSPVSVHSVTYDTRSRSASRSREPPAPAVRTVSREISKKEKKPSKPLSRPPSIPDVTDGGGEKEFEGDENEERGNWSNKMDFVLSCLGYAVGLGNVWRFPYLAYRNGGGAFLIPYTIMLFFAGLPLFLMEVSFGQYCSLGPISIWRSVPIARGIGYCQMFTACIQGVYYNVIIMYTVYYFFASFTSELPWIGCANTWNNVRCYDLYNDCVDNGGIIATNGSCLHLDSLNDTTLSFYNVTSNLGGYNLSGYTDPLGGRRELASEQYWKNAVLQEADTMNEPGGVIWQLALCLLVAWIIVLLCLVRGIKSSGKVVYFTATFPYAVLFILLIRGVTLPGAGDGIRFFTVPDFSRLSDAKVWQDAAIQIFYSLSAAGGGLVTLSSYNKFHNNCYFDSLFVAVANCCTSVFAGFVIFSIVGFMAHELNQPVETVVQQGFGLAFIAYPAAVARMPVSPLWSLLFFGMLITLGLDSQFAIMENLVTAIVDEFPRLRKKKTYVLMTACGIMYIMGFSCITHTGSYWVSHLDSYGAFFNYIIYALLECIALGWIYGVKRLQNDIRTMVGDRWVGHWSFMWWPLNWAAFTPALMLFVLMFNFLNWQEPSYNGPFPPWARAIGWMVTTCSLIWIPVVIIYEFLMEEGTFMERWRLISNPIDTWGPALPQFRLESWKVHHRNRTTMGGRLDIDGSGRRWQPGEVTFDEDDDDEKEVGTIENGNQPPSYELANPL